MDVHEISGDETLDQAPKLHFVPTLSILSGKKKGRIVVVKGDTFSIGRSHKCNLTLKDKQVSRIHAELRLKDGKYQICDLDSKWGVHVKGQKVSKSDLKYGDEFEVAGVLFKFDISSMNELKPENMFKKRMLIIFLIATVIIAAATLFYFKLETEKNLELPGGDVLSQIIYHYDLGINYYNAYDKSDPANKDLAIKEMKAVIELDPESKTRFSRSARRIIDGLEK